MSLPRLLLLLLLAACTPAADRADAPVDPERPWRQPGDAVDSIFPVEVMLARFRGGLDSVGTFAGGATDPEALATAFLAAVAAGDSGALGAMHVTPAEFAWLVYPDHIYARPPYELDPAIQWLQIQAASAKGIARVLERYGSRPLAFRALECPADTLQFVAGAVVKGWGPCRVTYASGDSVLTRRLFGTIVARDGRAKFLGYANEF